MLIQIAAGLFIAIVVFNVLCAILGGIGCVIEDEIYGLRAPPEPTKPINWKWIGILYGVILPAVLAYVWVLKFLHL